MLHKMFPKMSRIAQHGQICPELPDCPESQDLHRIGILIFLPENSEEEFFWRRLVCDIWCTLREILWKGFSSGINFYRYCLLRVEGTSITSGLKTKKSTSQVLYLTESYFTYLCIFEAASKLRHRKYGHFVTSGAQLALFISKILAIEVDPIF